MFSIILASLLSLAPAPAGGQLTLVRDGKTNWVIVVLPDATEPVRHGALELQKHIELMSGARLPIVDASASHPAGAIILRVDSTIGPEAFRIRTVPEGIEISGDGGRGLLYGCYGLLEDVFGCRWYTAKISKVPKKSTLRVGPLDIKEKPAFEYREPYYWEAFDRDWAVRNRTNGNAQRLDDTVGGKVMYGPFVHTFNSLVPPDKYFDTHPEYFSMVGGKRRKGYYQLCLTNPDVLKISIERVRQWIKHSPKATIFSVSQNDTDGHCQCDACKAVEAEEGAPSGVVLRFVNAVADAIAKDHPHVLIDTLAYQWTEKPPKHVRPRPNVRIRLAPIGACVAHPLCGCEQNKTPLANLLAWSKITDQLYIWHYSTNFAHFLQPLPDLDEIAGTIPLFKKQGVVGIFYEGNMVGGGGGEMSELKAYLMAKLMWNPKRDSKAIIDEFLTGVFGPAAPQIKTWLDLLHKPARKSDVHARIYDPPTAPYLSDELLAAGTRLFDEAEAAAKDDPVALDQAQRARLALEYVQLCRSTPDKPAPGGLKHAALVNTVTAKIARYKISSVREGEPVSRFLKRIGKAK
ncbi:MAG: DUF4838 domain-containing protein [Isosphaeraceae bacterium]